MGMRMKGGISMEIRIDKTKHSHGKGSQYHAVLKNPYVNYYDSKVIWGSTPEIVQRKAEQQLKKWEKMKSSKVQFAEPVDSDEDYLPFN